MAETAKAVKDAQKSRPKRVPLGSRSRLRFDEQDPNFVYRVINDQDDRLKRAQEAGYEFVHGDDKLGDERVGESGAIDTRISKPVGGNVRGFLMRIPKEFYEEDQAAKLAAISETEAAMAPTKKKTEIQDAYGEGLSKSTS